MREFFKEKSSSKIYNFFIYFLLKRLLEKRSIDCIQKFMKDKFGGSFIVVYL